MNLIHLFTISVLALSFSGRPAPASKKIILSPTESVVVKDEETEEFIPWNNEQRLDWDDFKCEPKKGTDAVASTSTTLGIAYQLVDGVLTYDITCNFSKVKSWGLMKTDYILAHEQGHFDITEIYARKLNEALKNYTFNKKTFKKDINQIYQNIVREKENFQKSYDEETDHSRNRRLQFDWLEKIQKELEGTEGYSAYP
jgi:hypothetical protein